MYSFVVNLTPIVECKELKESEARVAQTPKACRVYLRVQPSAYDGEHVHKQHDEHDDGPDTADRL